MQTASQQPDRKRLIWRLLAVFCLCIGVTIQAGTPVAAAGHVVDPRLLIMVLTSDIDGGKLHGQGLADTYLARGMFRFQLHQVTGAIADFTRGIETVDSMDLRQRRAEAYVSTSDYTDALADYAVVATMQPGSAVTHLRRAEILQMTGDRAGYDSELKQAFALTNDRAKLLWDGGVFQDVRGNYQIAYNDETAALAISPGQFVIAADRGAVEISLGRYQDAIADFDVALKADPGQHTAHNTAVMRMTALYALGRYPEAAAQGLAVDSPDAYVLLWLYMAQARTGGSDLAARAAKTDLTGWPGPVVAYLEGRMSESDLETAASDGAQPEELEYRLCEFQFYMGEAARIHGDNSGAVSLLNAAVKDCPYAEIERAAAQFELRAMGQAAGP